MRKSESQRSSGSGSAGASGREEPAPSPLIEKRSLSARAVLVGERIDVRALPAADRLASGPAAVSVGDGVAVLFRYGVVVLFGVEPSQQTAFLEQLRPLIVQPADTPERESVEICVDTEHAEGIESETIFLQEPSIERLQLVAHVLGASVVLACYESMAAQDFDRIEPCALEMKRGGRASRGVREMLAHIGGALLREQRMVGRAEVSEKPELLWDHPELERLYARLEDEFELRERHRAVERKLQLVARTAQTALEVLQDRRILRVEWYIVILIVMEIVLTVYELFLRGH